MSHEADLIGLSPRDIRHDAGMRAVGALKAIVQMNLLRNEVGISEVVAGIIEQFDATIPADLKPAPKGD